jgi:ABC-type multidrug transport system fused ATPase/permease subunit
VHAHHFISKLPQGYETWLGEDNVVLDAGQAYRIGLARALARDPALLVIEEPGTALDEDTKSLLGDTYDRLIAGRTVIFLPTRLSTVRRADRVVLVHEGQVAETGRHEDLVRSSDLYRHWEYTRFNAFGAVPVVSSTS